MDTTTMSKFQYTNPRITSFQYSFADLPDGEWKMGIKHNKVIEKISENQAKVVLDMMICAKDSPSPFEFIFSIEAKFRWTDYDTAMVSALLSQTAPALLVGYARPIVAMFTNSSGIPSFNIPFIDFTKEPVVDFSKL